MWWIPLLLACGPPSTTGPRGVVGQALDAYGIPFAGEEVSTDRDSTLTDEDGRFALRWDERAVWCDWARVRWTLRVPPDVDGSEVVLRHRRLRHDRLRCGLDEPATATLAWDLGDGLHARTEMECDPRQVSDLVEVLRGEPELTCRSRSSGQELDCALRETPSGTWLAPPPAALRIRVTAEDGPLPDDCAVRVGHAEAAPTGDGWWVITTSGMVTASATCAGRPARPVTLSARQGPAELAWSPTGPEIDFPHLPETEAVTVVREGEDGWSIRVPVRPDGRVLLPPLDAGTYRFAFGDAGLLVSAVQPEPGPAGTIHLLGRVGVLVLDADLDQGSLPVEFR